MRSGGWRGNKDISRDTPAHIAGIPFGRRHPEMETSVRVLFDSQLTLAL